MPPEDDDCPLHDIITRELAEGANLEEAWAKRCEGCNVRRSCPFHDEQQEAIIFHQQRMEMSLLKFRVQAAIGILAFIGLVICGCLVYGALADFKHWTYGGTPVWFIDLIKFTIASGMLAFSSCAIAFKNATKMSALEKNDKARITVSNLLKQIKTD